MIPGRQRKIPMTVNSVQHAEPCSHLVQHSVPNVGQRQKRYENKRFQLQKDCEMYNLKMCVWEITLACCFSCKYCGSSGGKARENELTTEECLSVADQLHELGCRRVSMIGGEVFMRKDWKGAESLAKSAAIFIATCMFTAMVPNSPSGSPSTENSTKYI